MPNQEVAVAKFTRREFREALDAGKFGTAIIPTGSNEQHLEHLAMEYDIRAATYVATEAARRLYPNVVVNVPMAVGISEHHMIHKGTVTAKPGSWLSVLFDAGGEPGAPRDQQRAHSQRARGQRSSHDGHPAAVATLLPDDGAGCQHPVPFVLEPES